MTPNAHDALCLRLTGGQQSGQGGTGKRRSCGESAGLIGKDLPDGGQC